MDAKSIVERRAPLLTPEQFANLGDGMIAYVKEMRSEDVNRLYPQAPHIQPGLTIFALIVSRHMVRGLTMGASK